MSVILTVEPARAHLLVPGADGLRTALETLRKALEPLGARAHAPTLAAACVGLLWASKGHLTQLLREPRPTLRTTHLLTVRPAVDGRLMLSIAAVCLTEEDDASDYGLLHEPPRLLADVLEDIPRFVEAMS